MLTRVLRVSCLLGLSLLVPLRAAAEPVPERPEKRPVPDYDGRDGKGHPTTPADATRWVPRIVLFPLYLTSEYLIRRPLGWAIASAERAQVPAALYDFFAFGPDHKAGFVPIAFVDFGFQPSVGVYLFWDDAGFKGHQLRARGSTWGADWLTGVLAERFPVGPGTLTLATTGARRPDYVFYGLGPRSREEDRSRYGSNSWFVRGEYELPLARSSSVVGDVGFRSASFYAGRFGEDPSTPERVAAGAYPQPPGFDSGYSAVVSSLKLVLDSRRPEPPRGSGVRLQVDAEHGTDLRGQPFGGWLRYGAMLGGSLDLADNGRALSLNLATSFADPTSSAPVPFTELVTLGGTRLLPGLREARLRDRSGAVATLRYTWPIWIWLNAGMEAAVGNVFGPGLAGLEPDLLRLSAAMGFETRGSRDSIFRAVIGFGTSTFRDGTHPESVRLTFGGATGL
jgi:hypothetical protein